MKRRTRKMIQAIIYVVVGFVFSISCMMGIVFSGKTGTNDFIQILICMVLAMLALAGVCLVDYAVTYIWKRIRRGR